MPVSTGVGATLLFSSELPLTGLLSLLARLGRVAMEEESLIVSSLASFSLLDFLGRVMDVGLVGVTGVSGTDMVCHLFASSLKFFEPGELIPLVIFFCPIIRSFGRSFLPSSLDLESFEIVSPIDPELNPLEYFFSRSDHFLPLLGDFSSISFEISSEMAESLLIMLLLRANGAFSDTMLLFLLDLLEYDDLSDAMLGVRDRDLLSVGVTEDALSTTSLMKATFSSMSMMDSG